MALRRHLSQERSYPPHYQQSKPPDLNYIRSIGDLVTGEIERSLESASTNNLAPNQASIGRQMYSPISRPNSTDCHTTTTTSSNHANHVNVVSLLPTVTTPSTECVEGLAASLRDCLRTSAEEIQEPVGSSSSTAEQKDQAAESGVKSPNKKKRLSVDSNPDMSREKKHTEETHTQKWQDKFDSRFDRIFTFASTEMDKRRRSTESCSPRTEPFSSPRGKEPIGMAPNEPVCSERTPDRKSDSKSSHSSRKDKQKEPKESKTSEKKRDKSRDRDKSSRSKSSREKDRDKDKDRDKEHRKHGSSSKHNHNHEKKKIETSVVDKDKVKIKEREREKEKKESYEKRSDERAEKHKHRDKGRERERHRDKHRDRERRNSKETKLPKMKQERKEESISVTESIEDVRKISNQEGDLKEERSNNEGFNYQPSTLRTDSVANGESVVNGTVKMEEELTDERLHEYNNEGHHHFKKRMVQSQMDWQTSDADLRRDEKQHQPPSSVKTDSLGLDTHLRYSASHQVTPTVELKDLQTNPINEEFPSQKQYSKKKLADWSTQVTSTDSSAFSKMGFDMKTDPSSPQHQHPTSSNPPRDFSNLNTGAPLPHPASTKLPMLSHPHPNLPSIPMNSPFSSSTFDLPSSDVNSQSFSRQFQQPNSRSGLQHYTESNYLTG